MTTHYLDLSLLPDPEIGSAELLGVLFTRFHRELVRLGAENIGVSFPQYSTVPMAIGNILRLHSTASHLDEFMEYDWLKGVRDHVHLGGILRSPETAEFRTLTRKQFKTNVHRLRRRRMRRKGETAEQAVIAIPSSVERKPDLPFVHLKSASTGRSFRLHLKRGPVRSEPVSGSYNSYGLSGKATVPWF